MATTTQIMNETPSASPTTSSTFIIRAVFDFNKFPGGATDDWKGTLIPAGTVIIDSWYMTTTAEGDSQTIDIGIAQNGTEITSNLNVQNVGTNYTQGSYTASAPYYASSDAYIWVNSDGATLTNAKVEVTLLCIKQSNSFVSQ